MIPVSYAHDVVEEAVLLAEGSAARELAGAFRQARDRAYDIADADRRESAFREVHWVWFQRFGLDGPFDLALGQKPGFSDRLSQCRVLRAVRPQEEGADLFDRAVPAGETGCCPLLVIRVRPALLLETQALSRFLRHELTHISDILDPAFDYRRTLPPSDDGPSADNVLRDRYRTIWDVTIDGRLARQGFADPEVRAVRAREFAAAFPMLGDDTARLFEEWFDCVEPTHERLVEFAGHPPAAGQNAHTGRCPLCRFPVASLDQRPERLSAEACQHIEREHPGWHIDQGLCPQCLDLYEAQYVSNHGAS
jgi:hypothetical protein